MSQSSFSSLDSALLVRDAQGRYLPATTDQILEAARHAVEAWNCRPELVARAPLCALLAAERRARSHGECIRWFDARREQANAFLGSSWTKKLRLATGFF